MMSGTNLPSDLEQIFSKVAGLAEFYLEIDLDEISKEKISSDLNYLENLRQFRSTDRNIKRGRGLIAKIIPQFYSTSG